jgi:hypothetical protein
VLDFDRLPAQDHSTSLLMIGFFCADRHTDRW